MPRQPAKRLEYTGTMKRTGMGGRDRGGEGIDNIIKFETVQFSEYVIVEGEETVSSDSSSQESESNDGRVFYFNCWAAIILSLCIRSIWKYSII